MRPQLAWWELALPLELAVMRRMGLHYPTADEVMRFMAEHPEHENAFSLMDVMLPPPDMNIVFQEEARLRELEPWQL